MFTTAYHNRSLHNAHMGLLQMTSVFTTTYHDRTLCNTHMALINLKDIRVYNCLLQGKFLWYIYGLTTSDLSYMGTTPHCKGVSVIHGLATTDWATCLQQPTIREFSVICTRVATTDWATCLQQPTIREFSVICTRVATTDSAICYKCLLWLNSTVTHTHTGFTTDWAICFQLPTVREVAVIHIWISCNWLSYMFTTTYHKGGLCVTHMGLLQLHVYKYLL